MLNADSPYKILFQEDFEGFRQKKNGKDVEEQQ